MFHRPVIRARGSNFQFRFSSLAFPDAFRAASRGSAPRILTANERTIQRSFGSFESRATRNWLEKWIYVGGSSGNLIGHLLYTLSISLQLSSRFQRTANRSVFSLSLCPSVIFFPVRSFRRRIALFLSHSLVPSLTYSLVLVRSLTPSIHFFVGVSLAPESR